MVTKRALLAIAGVLAFTSLASGESVPYSIVRCTSGCGSGGGSGSGGHHSSRDDDDGPRTPRTKPIPHAVANNAGVDALNAGNYTLAIEDFTRAIRLNPRYTLAHINLGLTYVDLRRYQDALNELQIAFNLGGHKQSGYPKNTIAAIIAEMRERINMGTASSLFDRGKDYLDRKDWAQAEKAFRDCMTTVPRLEQSYGCYWNAAYVRGSQGDFAEALRLYQQILAYMTGSPALAQRYAKQVASLNKNVESVRADLADQDLAASKTQNANETSGAIQRTADDTEKQLKGNAPGAGLPFVGSTSAGAQLLSAASSPGTGETFDNHGHYVGSLDTMTVNLGNLRQQLAVVEKPVPPQIAKTAKYKELAAAKASQLAEYERLVQQREGIKLQLKNGEGDKEALQAALIDTVAKENTSATEAIKTQAAINTYIDSFSVDLTEQKPDPKKKPKEPPPPVPQR